MTLRVLIERDGLETWFNDYRDREECELACERLRERGFTPRVQEIVVTAEDRQKEKEGKNRGLADQ